MRLAQYASSRVDALDGCRQRLFVRAKAAFQVSCPYIDEVLLSSTIGECLPTDKDLCTCRRVADAVSTEPCLLSPLGKSLTKYLAT